LGLGNLVLLFLFDRFLLCSHYASGQIVLLFGICSQGTR
jgi:hypothetical protein